MMPKKRLVFVDEAGFDEFLYRQHARALKGQKVIARISGKKFERQSVVGAKRDKEILAPFGYSGTCDTNLFNFWLKTQLAPKLRKGQVVILDNAAIHKSEETRMIIEKAGCYLVFLPPYSPDLNPIEHTWAHKKQFIRSNMHKFSSLTDAINYAFS
jgi:transposase